jgi:predicted nucleic acid-binding protein
MEFFLSENPDQQQKATKKLRQLQQSKEGIIPTIVISETIQRICQKVGKDQAGICYIVLLNSGLHIQHLTPTIAKEAGLLRSIHRNVPMGDCIIAATAKANQAKILSDDTHFDELENVKRVWL